MMDTQETNLPEIEEVKLEQTNAPETNPESATEVAVNTEAVEYTEDPESADSIKLGKDEILEKLTIAVNSEASRGEIDSLKQAFYKIYRQEVNEHKEKFIENGGDEKDFKAPEDECERKLKEILSVYREKKASQHAAEEQLKAANYALKLQLIERLKELTESPEDFNKLYNEFKEIQQRWKEAKAVPQEHANELWKTYQIFNEKFYDLIKINHQLRDYDFRKNLESKTTLCETVEKLVDSPDIVGAFNQLQKLHVQWRETGPVSKDMREGIWARFKVASNAINKRYQGHFEHQKQKEQSDMAAKLEICEKMESIDFTSLKTIKEWDAKQQEALELQKQWKDMGYAPRKYNKKLVERYRKSMDAFFKQKSEFSKGLKTMQDKNLELKRQLCEKAEALKESTDWKEATEKMIGLQKEWKSIGNVARKHTEGLWKQFISACDYFFEQKAKANSSQRGDEQNNLNAKKEIIAKITAIDESLDYEQALELLKGYMAEWNVTGFVPFKDKDKLHTEYHNAVEAQFDRLKVDRSDRKLQAFRSNLTEMGEKGKNKLYGERDKLMRTYERMKSELQTYENNIGFFNVSSKGGGGLLKEMNNKIERLKEEMNLMIKKIEAIDENLE